MRIEMISAPDGLIELSARPGQRKRLDVNASIDERPVLGWLVVENEEGERALYGLVAESEIDCRIALVDDPHSRNRSIAYVSEPWAYTPSWGGLADEIVSRPRHPSHTEEG